MVTWMRRVRGHFVTPEADEQELATPILSLCHGIFTDWSIFSTPFLLSCDWLWHSRGSLIQSRFDLKINRSMKTHAPTHRLLCKQISWLKLREFAGHVIVQIAPAGCYTPLVLHQCKRTCFRVFNKGRPHGAHVIRSQREIKNRDVNENPKMFEIL